MYTYNYHNAIRYKSTHVLIHVVLTKQEHFTAFTLELM